ncbi:MAG: M20/M25/M40 family metallo-hydrolase [Patescibacteria group bacterium]
MQELKTILETTCDLIRFRTTPDNPAEIERCLSYARDFLKTAGWMTEDFVNNGTKSLYAGSNREPKILFAAHLDVVPAEEVQFGPKEINGRLYGRGALDMKSGTAVLLHLLAEIGPRPEIGLILTTDEETGGFNGTKFVLEQGIMPKVVILPDGGKDWQNIVHKEKGVLWVKVVAQGKPAHGSVPWQGENAILKLNKALESITSGFLPHAEHPDDHWVATCNIGKIEGGTASNKVAETASAVCDIRLTENDNPDGVFEKLVSSMPEGINLEKLLDEPLVFVPQDNPIIQVYAEAIKTQGGNPKFTLDYGSSDARFFTPQNIPVILSQPTGDGHHGIDEWVDIASIQKYHDTVREFIRLYAGF